MKRILEMDDMGDVDIMLAYDNLKTLDLVNDYFLNRALELCSFGKILDIGCGTGKMLRQIREDEDQIQGYELYGLDIDERLIEYAKKQDPQTMYEVGDSNNLPYESESFDLVMCHSLLHHLEDPRKTINEILRVVKPDGGIFIRDLIRPASEDILQRLFLGYLAGHYDEQNKRLFENSLRSSFTYDEWKRFFPEYMDVSRIFFYNVAESFGINNKGFTPGSTNPKTMLNERKLRELEFVVNRLIEPIVHQTQEDRMIYI